MQNLHHQVAIQPNTGSALSTEQKTFLKDWATKQEHKQTALVVAATLERGNILRMMRIEEPSRVVAALTLELEHCAKTYSGCTNVGDDVWSELTSFVLTRFAHLGISEIREAFRLASAGELGDVNFRSYYGTFTGIALGEVLQAYDRFRKSNILASLQVAEAAQRAKDAEAEMLRRAARTAELEQARIEKLMRLRFPTVNDVMAHDYDVLLKLGYWVPKDRKEQMKAIYERAQKELLSDLKSEQMANAGNIEFRNALGRVIASLEASDLNQDAQAKTKAYAKRLAVVEWILEKQQAECEPVER